MRHTCHRAQRLAAKLLIGTVLATASATSAFAQNSGPGASTNAGTISGVVSNGGMPAFTGATSNTAGADTSNITLGSSRTILNWNSFNLNAGDTLNFITGASSDIVLNRVTGGSGTQINGLINGTVGSIGGAIGGNVWFLDSAGIAVGGNAVVNVGGLLLSTSGLADADFFNDNSFNFSGSGTGAINVAADLGAAGQLIAASGAITLLGSQIAFNGRANASGSNALVGANSAQILFNSNLDAYVGITINEGTAQNVTVGSSATFDAGSVASGGRTIIAAAGTSSLGQILLSGTSADRVDFIEGDVVIYSAASTAGTTDPRSIVSGGVVQNLVSGAAPTLSSGYISATGGSVDIRGAADVVVDGLTASVGNVRVEAGSLLTVNSSVSTKGDYSIIADDWTGAGVFAPTFTGSAGVGDFNITDTAGGLTIGGRTAPDDLRITTVNGALAISGGALTATAGNIELSTSGNNSAFGIDINAPLVTGTGAGRYVAFDVVGGVNQTAPGTITTNTLRGNALQFMLVAAPNQISNLGQMSTFRDMRITDAGGGLALTGNLTATDGFIVLNTPGVLSAGNVVLTSLTSKYMDFTGSSIGLTGTTLSGNVQFHSPVVIGGNVTITPRTSFYDATFDSTIAGDGLAGADSLTVNGNAVLNAAVNNSLANLTVGGTTFSSSNISVGNNLTLKDLSVYGVGAVALSAGGNLVLSGTANNYNINPGNLSLTGATITAGTIGTAAAEFANVTFTGTSRLTGNVLADGDVIFNNALALGAGAHTVSGANVTFRGAVQASAADDVQLRVNGTSATTGFVSFAGSILDIDRLAVNARQLLDIRGINRIGTIALISNQGALSIENTGLLTVGTVDGISGITVSNGGLNLISDGGLNLQNNVNTAGYLLLRSNSGSITQATGAGITALGLSAYAGRYEEVLGDILLSGNNDVDNLDGAAYGNFVFNNSGPLTLGYVTGATGVNITTSGNMTVNGIINNSHVGNLALTSGGTMTINENITADHQYTDHGNVSLTSGGLMSSAAGKTIVANDIALTASDFSGNLGTTTLMELRDVSITDTAGGLTIGALTDLNAVRNLSITTTGGGNLNVGGIAPGGAAILTSSGALTVTENIFAAGSLTATAAGPIAINGLAQSGANALVRSTGGSLTIGATGQVKGPEVTLAAATTFSNSGGASAILANRWLVYSANPAADSFGGLNSNNTAIWNAAYGAVDASTISGNRYIFTYQPTLIVTTQDTNKVYGTDLTGATSGLYAINGLHTGVAGAFLGDSASTAFSGAPLISSGGLAANANVAGGPYAITASIGSMASSAGYAITLDNKGAITVTPKALTGTVTANNKTYDGTTNATGSVNLSGIVAGDAVTASALLAFADKNAGSNKTVTISGGSLAGSDAGNYTLSLPASTLATILQRAISVTADPATKTAGSTDPQFSFNVTSGGLVAGDVLTGALSRDPGEAAGLYNILQGSLAASSNYQLSFVANVLTITAAAVSGRTDLPDFFRPVVAYGDNASQFGPQEALQVLDERTLCSDEDAKSSEKCAGR